MKLLSLIYVSSAVRLFNEVQLIALLQKSREKNHQAGLTGMLLYHDGNFMQLLEGEETSVMNLLGIIRKDPRHKDMLVLLKEYPETRRFADWSMGFRNLNKLSPQELTGYNQFLTKGFMDQEFQDNPQRAMILLETFRDVIR